MHDSDPGSDASSGEEARSIHRHGYGAVQRGRDAGRGSCENNSQTGIASPLGIVQEKNGRGIGVNTLLFLAESFLLYRTVPLGCWLGEGRPVPRSSSPYGHRNRPALAPNPVVVVAFKLFFVGYSVVGLSR